MAEEMAHTTPLIPQPDPIDLVCVLRLSERDRVQQLTRLLDQHGIECRIQTISLRDRTGAMHQSFRVFVPSWGEHQALGLVRHVVEDGQRS